MKINCPNVIAHAMKLIGITEIKWFGETPKEPDAHALGYGQMVIVPNTQSGANK